MYSTQFQYDKVLDSVLFTYSFWCACVCVCVHYSVTTDQFMFFSFFYLQHNKDLTKNITSVFEVL